MGFLDNLVKTIDSGIKAVESGELEKKLSQAADSVENVLRVAEDGVNMAESKVSGVNKQAGKALDGIADKLPKT